MSVTWSTLRGDTSRFAVEVRFETCPDPDPHAPGGYRSSWGALAIWVDGLNICTHADRGEQHDVVRWYLLPVLEWLAVNWAPLLHEEPLPSGSADEASAAGVHGPAASELGSTAAEAHYAWWERHALAAAADGGLLPGLHLRRWGDLGELSWESRNRGYEPEGWRFASPFGTVRLPATEVAEVLEAVLLGATAELLTRHPDDARLLRLEDRCAVLGVSLEEAESWFLGPERATLLPALLAADPAPAPQPSAERERVRPMTPLAALFGSLSPVVTEGDVTALREAVARADGSGVGEELHALGAAASSVLSSMTQDYEQGNVLAERVREELALADDESPDMEAVLERLGVAVRVIALDDDQLRGVTLVGPDHGPTIFLNSRFRSAERRAVQRFSLAHELAHLVVDRDRARELAVASGPWAPADMERRANAFAAAFLLPEELVAEAAGLTPQEAGGWASSLSSRTDVSRTTVIDRARNLGYIPRVTWEELRLAGH